MVEAEVEFLAVNDPAEVAAQGKAAVAGEHVVGIVGAHVAAPADKESILRGERGKGAGFAFR